MLKTSVFLMTIIFIFPATLLAKKTAEMYTTDGEKTALGRITFRNSPLGMVVTTRLKNLPAGDHGFHVHQNPSCADAGTDAGGHYDPKDTKNHLGPHNDGHLGDLPILVVNEKGVANTKLIAPRLSEKDLVGRSVVIHAHGDNYSDTPEKLGGGGARIACGVIK